MGRRELKTKFKGKDRKICRCSKSCIKERDGRPLSLQVRRQHRRKRKFEGKKRYIRDSLTPPAEYFVNLSRETSRSDSGLDIEMDVNEGDEDFEMEEEVSDIGSGTATSEATTEEEEEFERFCRTEPDPKGHRFHLVDEEEIRPGDDFTVEEDEELSLLQRALPDVWSGLVNTRDKFEQSLLNMDELERMELSKFSG